MVHPDRTVMVSAIEFSPDGSLILGSTYPENTIQIWDAKTGRQLETIRTPKEHKASERFWKTNEDFSKVFVCFEGESSHEKVREGEGDDAKEGIKVEFQDSRIEVWNTKTGKLESRIQSDPPSMFRMLEMSPDKKHLVTLEKLPWTYFGNQRAASHRFRLREIDSGKISELDRSIQLPISFNESGDRMVSFIADETRLYSVGISIFEFPSMKEIKRIELPEGINRGNELRFSSDQKHLLLDYQTYEHKGVWNNWKTTISCIEVESGKVTGSYDFPFENDSPIFVSQQLSDGSLAFTTWRTSPARVLAVSVPDMKQRWDVELGDYDGAMVSVVSQDKEYFAALCIAKTDAFAGTSGKVDWDLVPQNDLKIVSRDGKVLETIVLPVGATTITMSPDGQSTAIGALGSIHTIDLSGPFENK